MSAQVLSPRSTRRIARGTGEDVIRAWAHGGYVMQFVTSSHRHGWWSKKDESWGWHEDQDGEHYSPWCTLRFGDEDARGRAIDYFQLDPIPPHGYCPHWTG